MRCRQLWLWCRGVGLFTYLRVLSFIMYSSGILLIKPFHRKIDNIEECVLTLLTSLASSSITRSLDLQLAFAPKAWRTERASWRAVIQLNLVRSINTILDVLNAEMTRAAGHPTSPVTSPFMRPVTSPTVAPNANESSSPTSESPSSQLPFQFSHTHALLKLRLAPLRRVEADLKQLIGAATDEPSDIPGLSLYGNGNGSTSGNGSGSGTWAADDLNAAAPFDGASAGTVRRRPSEYYVRSNASWREAVRSAYHKLSGNDDGSSNGSGRGSGGTDGSKLEDATEIIASCAEDMKALWEDATVRDVLKRRRIRMELAPGL